MYKVNGVEYTQDEVNDIVKCNYCNLTLDEGVGDLRQGAFGDYFCEEESCVYDYVNEFDVVEVEEREVINADDKATG